MIVVVVVLFCLYCSHVLRLSRELWCGVCAPYVVDWVGWLHLVHWYARCNEINESVNVYWKCLQLRAIWEENSGHTDWEDFLFWCARWKRNYSIIWRFKIKEIETSTARPVEHVNTDVARINQQLIAWHNAKLGKHVCTSRCELWERFPFCHITILYFAYHWTVFFILSWILAGNESRVSVQPAELCLTNIFLAEIVISPNVHRQCTNIPVFTRHSWIKISVWRLSWRGWWHQYNTTQSKTPNQLGLQRTARKHPTHSVYLRKSASIASSPLSFFPRPFLLRKCWVYDTPPLLAVLYVSLQLYVVYGWYNTTPNCKLCD